MGGSWVRHIANKNDTMLIPYNPKAVIISTGGNDASGGVSSTQIVSEVQAYIDSLIAALPGVPIIYVDNWCSPGVVADLSNKNTRLRVNEEMIQYCENKENVWYLDTSSVVKAENADYWLADRRHMNATGYRNVAPLFLAKLNEIFAAEDPGPAPIDPAPTQPQTQNRPQPKGSIIPWICGGIMLAAVAVLAVVLIPKKKKD